MVWAKRMFHWTSDGIDIRALRWISLTGLVIVAPFAIIHGLRGEWLLLASTGGFTLVLIVVAWQVWKPAGRIAPNTLLAGVALANISTVIAAIQVPGGGIYWCFAATGGNGFVLGPRVGLIFNSTLGLAMLATVSTSAETGELVRFGASFILLSTFVYIFSMRVHQKQHELQRLTQIDPLTGVGNRRSLEKALQSELAKARRYGYTASLVSIDLDHFKAINDTHGHAMGDRFLIDFAHMVENRVRDSDLVFRMGGEEFLILAPATSAAGAYELAEDLRTGMPSTPLAELTGHTFSAGISELRLDDTAAGWLSRADQALYRAKESGRNRVTMNLPSDNTSAAALGNA
ncbi:MAG: sensor domain-containing diguanylate cyclase [Proteobacteria bacterium]|nr:MAG: sensor domain-containing diguanylate cyclase [Pseudomonadota bacterium]